MSNLKELLKKQSDDFSAKKKQLVEYKVDTIRINKDNYKEKWLKGNSSGAYYSPNSDEITIGYFKVDTLGMGRNALRMMKKAKANNEYYGSDETLIHEQKHKNNVAKGFGDLAYSKVSQRQHIKLRNHNEVSAQITELLLLRERYLKNGDLIDIEMQSGGRFSFYAEAIRRGDFDPENLADFDKEMTVIVNGAKDRWDNNCHKQYDPLHFKTSKSRALCPDDEKYYQKGLDVCYTFNGVNLKKYLKEDFKLSPELEKQVSDFENSPEARGPKPVYAIRNNSDFSQSGGSFFHDSIVAPLKRGLESILSSKKSGQKENSPKKVFQYKEFEQFSLGVDPLAYRGNMSLSQYHNLLQHRYIASKICHSTWFKAENWNNLDSELAKSCKAKISEHIAVAKTELKLDDKAAKSISDRVNKAFEDNKNVFFAPEANEKEYLAALDDIYTIRGMNYRKFMNINPQQKMPIAVSKQVKDFEDKGLFTRCAEKVAQWNIKLLDTTSEWLLGKKTSQEKTKAEIKTTNENKIAAKTEVKTNQPQFGLQPPVQFEPLPLTKTGPKIIPSEKTIDKPLENLQNVTSSYDADRLKELCGSDSRWNQERKCDSEQYTHAAQVTGLPPELIAYAYEVNRKNFPKQDGLGNKIRNGTECSNEEIIQNVAAVLGKYDIEKGSFFVLRETPREVVLNVVGNTKNKTAPQENFTKNSAQVIRLLRGQEEGVGKYVYNKTTFNPNMINLMKSVKTI